jgi:Zn-dependent protease
VADSPSAVAKIVCASCDAEVGVAMLACPRCGTLVYASRLKELAARAEERKAAGDPAAALAAWREAIELLPPESKQHEAVTAKIVELSNAVGNAPAKPKGRGWQAGAIGATALGLLGKGKLLLGGLAKASTLWSMLLAFGVYFKLWGWKYALGLIVTTYVHEMGHVFALRRYGFPATAPTFIPGLGAFVRLKQHPATPSEDAAIGLAGPIWGLAATAACWAVWLGTGWRGWLATAVTAGCINLFNLLPFAFLDGSRGFSALSRAQRVGAVAVVGAAAWVVRDSGYVSGLLMLIGIGGVLRVFASDAPKEGHVRSFITYVALIAALTFFGSRPISL